MQSFYQQIPERKFYSRCLSWGFEPQCLSPKKQLRKSIYYTNCLPVQNFRILIRYRIPKKNHKTLSIRMVERYNILLIWFPGHNFIPENCKAVELVSCRTIIELSILGTSSKACVLIINNAVMDSLNPVKALAKA